MIVFAPNANFCSTFSFARNPELAKKMENRSAYFYFSENLFLTKLSAMITNIIDKISVRINLHCYTMHFILYIKE